jgi:hypothetical protein
MLKQHWGRNMVAFCLEGSAGGFPWRDARTPPTKPSLQRRDKSLKAQVLLPRKSAVKVQSISGEEMSVQR